MALLQACSVVGNGGNTADEANSGQAGSTGNAPAQCAAHRLPHVPQMFSWDCGLACVLMVLRRLGCTSCDYQSLRKLSQTTSVWTVDLAHLLARYGAAVTFSTLTLGINGSYANEAFYMEHLADDAARVARLFADAPGQGICLVQRSIPLPELAAAVGGGGALAVLLVDRRKLDPWQAAADVAWNLTTGVTSATSYTGHYILLVGWEPPGGGGGGAAAQQAAAQAQADGATSSSSFGGVGGSGSGSCSSSATSGQQQPPSDAGGCEAGSDAAAAAAAAVGGYFWVHDPARSRGPHRVSVVLVEAARRSFGTDEDVLLVDVTQGLAAPATAAAAAAAAAAEAQAGCSSAPPGAGPGAAGSGPAALEQWGWFGGSWQQQQQQQQQLLRAPSSSSDLQQARGAPPSHCGAAAASSSSSSCVGSLDWREAGTGVHQPGAAAKACGGATTSSASSSLTLSSWGAWLYGTQPTAAVRPAPQLPPQQVGSARGEASCQAGGE